MIWVAAFDELDGFSVELLGPKPCMLFPILQIDQVTLKGRSKFLVCTRDCELFVSPQKLQHVFYPKLGVVHVVSFASDDVEGLGQTLIFENLAQLLVISQNKAAVNLGSFSLQKVERLHHRSAVVVVLSFCDRADNRNKPTVLRLVVYVLKVE